MERRQHQCALVEKDVEIDGLQKQLTTTNTEVEANYQQNIMLQTEVDQLRSTIVRPSEHHLRTANVGQGKSVTPDPQQVAMVALQQKKTGQSNMDEQACHCQCQPWKQKHCACDHLPPQRVWLYDNKCHPQTWRGGKDWM